MANLKELNKKYIKSTFTCVGLGLATSYVFMIPLVKHVVNFLDKFIVKAEAPIFDDVNLVQTAVTGLICAYAIRKAARNDRQTFDAYQNTEKKLLSEINEIATDKTNIAYTCDAERVIKIRDMLIENPALVKRLMKDIKAVESKGEPNLHYNVMSQVLAPYRTNTK
jgi:hypothetical protein